jgi:dCMP deaminase
LDYVEVRRYTLELTVRRTNESSGICAGKHAIAEYLIQHQGFQLLELTSKPPQITEPENDLRLQASEIRKKGDAQPEHMFENADILLDFATKRWQERWITTDIADANTLDRFLLRPFFLLVSVDAPVSLRWKRFADRFVAILFMISA